MQDEQVNDPLLGKIFFSKYTLNKKLGQGSFGKIYRAHSEKGDFAFKIEKRNKKGHSLLANEANVMKTLKNGKTYKVLLSNFFL